MNEVSFIYGFASGVVSVLLVVVAMILFYKNPVKRQVEDDEEEKFRFRRGQFNYMDNIPNANQYSDYMK